MVLGVRLDDVDSRGANRPRAAVAEFGRQVEARGGRSVRGGAAGAERLGHGPVIDNAGRRKRKRLGFADST